MDTPTWCCRPDLAHLKCGTGGTQAWLSSVPHSAIQARWPLGHKVPGPQTFVAHKGPGPVYLVPCSWSTPLTHSSPPHSRPTAAADSHQAEMDPLLLSPSIWDGSMLMLDLRRPPAWDAITAESRLLLLPTPLPSFALSTVVPTVHV